MAMGVALDMCPRWQLSSVCQRQICSFQRIPLATGNRPAEMVMFSLECQFLD
jgi:hypothetical protein